MDEVGRLLVELAADEEYLGPLIAEIPFESPGGSGWSGPTGVPDPPERGRSAQMEVRLGGAGPAPPAHHDPGSP